MSFDGAKRPVQHGGYFAMREALLVTEVQCGLFVRCELVNRLVEVMLQIA